MGNTDVIRTESALLLLSGGLLGAYLHLRRDNKQLKFISSKIDPENNQRQEAFLGLIKEVN